MPRKPTERFLTVVVRITDQEAARPFLDPIFKAFSEDTLIPGIDVTGMSHEDEMTRVEELEAELAER